MTNKNIPWWFLFKKEEPKMKINATDSLYEEENRVKGTESFYDAFTDGNEIDIYDWDVCVCSIYGDKCTYNEALTILQSYFDDADSLTILSKVKFCKQENGSNDQ